MKFCKDCKHYKFLDAISGAHFSHACFKFKDAVGYPQNCYDVRDSSAVCGPEAKGFEAVSQEIKQRNWFKKLFNFA